jgi:signal transduction histidine kinase/ligand-binding sensor domain-containing protein
MGRILATAQLTVIIFYGLSTSVVARSDNFRLQTWGTDSDLAHPTVVALAQTNDGYLWAATLQGVSRFDGIRFKNFGSGAHPSLVHTSALAGGSDTTLWIGTRHGEILSFSNGTFQTVLSAHSGQHPAIRSLAEDAQGVLWVTTDHSVGIIRDGAYDPISDRWHLRYGQSFKAISPEPGRIRIESDRGLWEPSGEDLRAIIEFPPGKSIRHLAFGPMDCHWGSESSKLVRWETVTGSTPRIIAEGGISCPYHFVTASADHDGGLWIASECEGIIHFSADGIRTVLTVKEGLGSARTLALLTDREGVIWAGTDGGGLSRITPAIFHHWNNHQRLNKVSVIHPRSDNSLFLGTHGNGVLRLKDDTIEIICEPLAPQAVDFTALALSSNGTLLGGTRQNGLLNLGIKIANPVMGIPQPESPIHAIVIEADLSLWLGRQGTTPLLHCTAKGARPVELNPQPSDIRALLKAYDSGLWIGSENHGLFRILNEQIEHLGTPAGIPTAGIRGLLETPNSLWVATAGSGLWRWKNGTLKACTTRDGLPADSITGLQKDTAGALWASTPQTFFRIDENKLAAWFDQTGPFPHPVLFGKADGVAGLGGYGDTIACSATTPDGRLWFATNGGLIEVRPDRFRAPLARATAVIEEMQLDGAAVPPGLPLPSNSKTISFHYNGLFLTAPESLTFETRLAPLESAWIPRGSKRSTIYTGLAPGKYNFEVRATDRHGRVSARTAATTFTIPPPLWLRPAFMISTILCLLGAAVAVTRAIMAAKLRRERERTAIERAINEERSRIARDMHDEISGGLMELALLGEHLTRDTARSEELSQVSTRSRELISAVNENVWLLNPQNDSVEGLASFLCRSALRWTIHSQLKCRFDVPPEFEEIPLTSQTRRQILLCCKEAIHNAIKHSGATELMIRIRGEKQWLEINILDNGSGFPDSPADTNGNGLSNIRQRMHSINGEVRFLASPEGGAHVYLLFRKSTSFP